MLKNLAMVLGLVVGLSACADPYYGCHGSGSKRVRLPRIWFQRIWLQRIRLQRVRLLRTWLQRIRILT
jgi:hypothetical protein